GCRHRRWLHAHHVIPWWWGGRTDLDNLVLLCPGCHRLVHELGWQVSGNANRELTFRRPDGRVLKTGPPGVRPEVGSNLRRALALV
ncbi:MAG TPA: HNH endonuclease signature motif containing protein, partial [Candidatus Dormibacteraeota bacterium]